MAAKTTPPSGKTVPSGGLSAASNPSARLQELLRRTPAAPDKNTEKNTEAHTEVFTDTNTENSTPPQTEALTEVLTEANTQEITDTHTEVMTPARMQRRKPIKVDASMSTTASVRQRIVEDLQKEPVVRKTIDIPASLNERLQDYCAAKRIKTERRVFLVLLENFLEEEGF